MESDIRKLVTAVHKSPYRLVLVTAGAGTKALSDLLGVAGASKTLLESIVPYSKSSFDDFLGQSPEKYVAEKTARLLAGRALTRARWLNETNKPSIGIACTATIITDRPKRGEHRAFVTIWHANRLVTTYIHLQKGARDRKGEEQLVSSLILNLLAQEIDIPFRINYILYDQDELETQTVEFSPEVDAVISGSCPFVGIRPDGTITRSSPKSAMLSGSFNPLHEGHLALAQVTEELIGQPVTFECSAINVDKPPLASPVILERMSQFAGRWPIYISTAPTYVEKSRHFPNVTFVVGHDTAIRIISPKYYKGDVDIMANALEEIRQNGCKFLVAGRVDDNGQFRDLSDIDIPDEFHDLFSAIPHEMFRKDISSTQLRQKGLRGSR